MAIIKNNKPHYTMEQLEVIGEQHSEKIARSVRQLDEKIREYRNRINELENTVDELPEEDGLESYLQNITDLKGKIDAISVLREKAKSQPVNVNEEDFALAWADKREKLEAEMLEASAEYYKALQSLKSAHKNYWDKRYACTQDAWSADHLYKRMNLPGTTSHIPEYPDLPKLPDYMFREEFKTNYSAAYNGKEIIR